MRLGEAILERDYLKERLELLGSRLTQDSDRGKPLTHLREEIQYTANRWKDLEIAISWTEQQVAIADQVLGAYRTRQKVFHTLAEIIEDTDREKADDFLAAAHTDGKVIATAIWLVDLQAPSIKEPVPNSEAKED